MKKIDINNLDKKSKIEIAVTSVMVLALVVILSNSIRTIIGGKKKHAPGAPAINASAFKEMARADLPISAAKELAGKTTTKAEKGFYQKINDMPWSRDPFVVKNVSVEAEGGFSDLVLEGLIWDENNPYAIINGETVKEGDKIGTGTVIKIEKDGVVVSDGNKRFRLRFW